MPLMMRLTNYLCLRSSGRAGNTYDLAGTGTVSLMTMSPDTVIEDHVFGLLRRLLVTSARSPVGLLMLFRRGKYRRGR